MIGKINVGAKPEGDSKKMQETGFLIMSLEKEGSGRGGRGEKSIVNKDMQKRLIAYNNEGFKKLLADAEEEEEANKERKIKYFHYNKTKELKAGDEGFKVFKAKTAKNDLVETAYNKLYKSCRRMPVSFMSLDSIASGRRAWQTKEKKFFCYSSAKIGEGENPKAMRRVFKKDKVVEKAIDCAGWDCEFFGKYKGSECDGCKFFISMNFFLNLGGESDGEYLFTISSIHGITNIRTFLDMTKKFTGGYISSVPFELYQTKRTVRSSEGYYSDKWIAGMRSTIPFEEMKEKAESELKFEALKLEVEEKKKGTTLTPLEKMAIKKMESEVMKNTEEVMDNFREEDFDFDGDIQNEEGEVNE